MRRESRNGRGALRKGNEPGRAGHSGTAGGIDASRKVNWPKISPRLRTWEAQVKLLQLATLAYAFLLSLFNQGLSMLRVWLLRWFCQRTGTHQRLVFLPLSRRRKALSRLWQAYPEAFNGRGATARGPGCIVSITQEGAGLLGAPQG
jgi:hypothetical protein